MNYIESMFEEIKEKFIQLDYRKSQYQLSVLLLLENMKNQEKSEKENFYVSILKESLSILNDFSDAYYDSNQKLKFPEIEYLEYFYNDEKYLNFINKKNNG